jgi:hypothetical protein
VYDRQGSFKGGIKPDTWYNLMLSINGLTATLIVNGTTAFSFTYQPTIVDDWAYGLNWGLVGFGSNNSRGAMDDIAVQVVPPAATSTRTDAFDTGTGPMFDGSATGAWSVAAGRLAGAPTGGSDTAIDLMNLAGVAQLQVTSLLDMSATFKTAGRAGFVFDRYSDTDFKWVAVDVSTKQVLIGHRTAAGWFVDAAVSRTTLSATADVKLGVTLRGSTVSVTLDDQAALGFVFNAVAVDGRFGVFTKGAGASFDSVTVKTNDPAVPAAEVTVAATTQGGAAALTDAQLQPLLAEARRRWALVEDPSHVARLDGVRVEIVDLPGAALGDYVDGRVLIDVDAAGHGWFVDPTPADDAEFGGTGAVRVATSGEAAQRIDLLSVLSHELGHVMGLGHDDGGVMDEQRLPGERATPDLWHAAAGDTTAFRLADPPAPSAAAPVLPRIDWTFEPASLAPAALSAREAAPVKAPQPDDWRARFVNHLGASAGKASPNASL